MKNSKKLSPLEELRLEKIMLKSQCSEMEEHMKLSFSYVTGNFGSILFTSILRNFGLGRKSSPSRNNDNQPNEEEDKSASSTILQTVLNGLQITYPYIKDLAQPLLMGFITNKIKNIFSKKHKKE